MLGLFLGLATRAISYVRKLFSPAELFANGEQGVWYDPSDIDRYMGSLGPELVINGDFSAGSTGWTAYAGTIAAVSGEMQVTNSGVSYGTGYQSLTTLVGKTYKVTLTAYAGTANTVYAAAKNALLTNPDLVAVSTSSKTSVPLTFSFTATGTTTLIVFVNSNQGNATGYFDDISVKEANFGNTATMYQDAAGTTPVTAVEQPVGLILDKSKGLALGAELVTNGDMSSATGWSLVGSSVSITGGKGVFTSTPANTDYIRTLASVAALKSYVIEFDAVITSGALVVELPFVIAICQVSVSGHYRGYFYASTAAPISFRTGSSLTGTIDNISVRELPGAHATQATAASRPLLSARVNLLTYSEDFSNAAWVKSVCTVAATGLPDGIGGSSGTRITCSANGGNGVSRSGLITPLATATEFSVYLKYEDWRWFEVVTVKGTATRSWVDLLNGVAGTANHAGFTVSPASNGYVRISGNMVAAIDEIYITPRDANGNSSAATTNSGKSWLMFGVQAETGSTATTYQRVTTASDYNAVGFPYFLKFDGVDDSLATASIDFTSTSQMSVFAGVRKLSDAAQGTLAELSVNQSLNNGSFYIGAPVSVAPNQNYWFTLRGTDSTAYAARTFAAPTTDILAANLNISGADRATEIILRVNGATPSLTGADSASAGTGNFGNYPLYIGRRGGTSLPFNGHIYQLVVRGSASTDAQITSTEKYVAGKTGVTL